MFSKEERNFKEEGITLEDDDGEIIYIRSGFITKVDSVKIYPFAIEDLSKSYNLTRFPNRKRRDAKVLKKYNFFGNIYVVIGYAYLVKMRFSKKSAIYISKDLSQYIDISETTFRVKISQLKSYIMRQEKTCSYDLIKTYLNYKNVPYSELAEVMNFSHKNLSEKRKAFEKLLELYPSEYKYEFDWFLYYLEIML